MPKLPPSDLYLLPSLDSLQVMGKKRYDALLERVANGATVYLSLGDTILSKFESFSGLRVLDSYVGDDSGVAVLDDIAIPYTRRAIFTMQPTTARVLATDANGAPFLTVNAYGKGRVYVVNAPLEKGLLGRHHAFDGEEHKLYQRLFGEFANHAVKVTGSDLAVTYHPTENGMTVVVVNHTAQDKSFAVQTADGYHFDCAYYGQADCVKAFDVCVLQYSK
jgi:hypothetical protein